MLVDVKQEIGAILRAQAWERAKGELNAMLVTIYNDPKKYEELASTVKQLVEHIEENGLQE